MAQVTTHRRWLPLLMLGLLLATTGCIDTCGQPEHPHHGPSHDDLVHITPGSFGSAPTQCTSFDGHATKSFVLIDNDGKPMRDADFDDGLGVDFQNSRFFALPDLPCADDADCPASMSCQSVSYSDDYRCLMATDISIDGAPRFSDHNRPDSQALLLAVANSGAWRGWYSSEMAGFYEFDPDQGTTTGHQLSSTPVRSLAVDPDNRRGPAFNQVALWWDELHEEVDADNRDAHFGLWTFAEHRGEVRSRLADVDPDERIWSADPSLTRDAVDEIPRDPDSGRTNVYESLVDILDDAFDTDTVQEVDTADVVLVVPGHDEIRQMDADDVLQKANDITAGGDVDVSVTIIQVDAERDVTEIPDDWAYYSADGADQSPCSNDDDCKNFETCREPTWYTDDSNASSEDDVVFPREDERGETFCMPDYDENGRIGPIADYQRIACETGGAYHYLPDVSRQVLEDQFRAQVWNSEASWELDVVIDDAPLDEPLLLETTFEVTGNLSSRSFEYSRDSTDRDRRRVLY